MRPIYLLVGFISSFVITIAISYIIRYDSQIIKKAFAMQMDRRRIVSGDDTYTPGGNGYCGDAWFPN